MVAPNSPLPGTRWVARRGNHAGVEIEVDHTTDNSVFFKTLGGGENWGNQKTDDSKVNRLALSSFRTLYSRKQDLAPGETHGGKAFRRVGMKKVAPVEEAPSMPLQLNGYIMSGNTPLNIEVLEITPHMAQVWLERGGKNRRVSPRLVIRLAAAIRRGEWMLTGDSIKIGEDNTVLDGQHRLHAIFQAGIPVTSLVVRNVAATAMDVIDTGRARKASDVLALHGYVSVAAVASAARSLLLIDRFGRYNANSREVAELVSNANILRYVEAHPEIHDGVRMGETLRGAGMAGGAGLLGAFCTLILRVDDEAAQEFAYSLGSGANLEPDSPILRLRNRLATQQRFYGSGDEREAYLAIAIKAWNAWRKGEQMKLLIWRESEGFPVPL